MVPDSDTTELLQIQPPPPIKRNLDQPGIRDDYEIRQVMEDAVSGIDTMLEELRVVDLNSFNAHLEAARAWLESFNQCLLH